MPNSTTYAQALFTNDRHNPVALLTNCTDRAVLMPTMPVVVATPPGYGLLRPDPLLPAWQLPTAQFAVIEWADDGKTARQQVHLLRCHQPACHLLLLLPNERSVVLQGVLLTATGYLAAPLSLAELVACLHRIRLGQGYWNPGLLVLLTGTLLTQDAYPSGLNQRERELWDHLANGLANPQIEVLMCLSGSRVKNLKTSLAQN